MLNKELEEQIDFLLSAALQKCEDYSDAEDLTQETLLCALSYTAKGNRINNLRGWLLTVLNHKWSDLLRKKYRQPVIYIGEGIDLIAKDEDLSNIDQTDEAEQIRKSIAFLARIYREVIVRHYMNGESVAHISNALGIPEGTVKSRLHSGREQIKKGFTGMENYSQQSYNPIFLNIANSGNNGINNEPGSLVRNDLLAQNILWAAYEKPITAEEISKAIGTPAAYVEPIIDKLINGELMKQVGNRYYTDFMISTKEDREKHIFAQKEFVKQHFDLLWAAIDKGLTELRQQDYYKRCTFDEKNSFELYFAFNCIDYGIHGICENIFQEKQTYPYRKDGGRWIAFGILHKNTANDETEFLKHCYSGERRTMYKDYAGCKLLSLCVYGADGFPTRVYSRFPSNIPLHNDADVDDIVTRLLHIIRSGIEPASVGFYTQYLQAIPHLTACKLLREENGKPHVNIPIINEAEFHRLYDILTRTKREIGDNKELERVFAAFLKDKKQRIPQHLDSVNIHKQYYYGTNAILFAIIREAMMHGKIHDGKYDEENQHPVPAFLVID